jgi:hypothetical protein
MLWPKARADSRENHLCSGIRDRMDGREDLIRGLVNFLIYFVLPFCPLHNKAIQATMNFKKKRAQIGASLYIISPFSPDKFLCNFTASRGFWGLKYKQ